MGVNLEAENLSCHIVRCAQYTGAHNSVYKWMTQQKQPFDLVSSNNLEQKVPSTKILTMLMEMHCKIFKWVARALLGTSVSCDTADHHQKHEYCDHWSNNTNFILLHVFCFLTKKCVKIVTMLRKILETRNMYRNLYFLIFDTKMTIFPCKVRHVLPRCNICRSLIAKYLHIHISDQNLKKV